MFSKESLANFTQNVVRGTKEGETLTLNVKVQLNPGFSQDELFNLLSDFDNVSSEIIQPGTKGSRTDNYGELNPGMNIPKESSSNEDRKSPFSFSINERSFGEAHLRDGRS